MKGSGQSRKDPSVQMRTKKSPYFNSVISLQHITHVDPEKEIAYAPTEDAAAGIKDDFYQQLSGAFVELPAHDGKQQHLSQNAIRSNR